MTEENSIEHSSLYIPFDQYFYRNVIELCKDFFKEFRKVQPGNVAASRKLANLFMTILDFARDCEDLPEDLRYPPLYQWNMYGSTVVSPLVVHPRLAMRYVMRLMNEIRRQQSNQKRSMTAIFDKFRGEEIDETD